MKKENFSNNDIKKKSRILFIISIIGVLFFIGVLLFSPQLSPKTNTPIMQLTPTFMPLALPTVPVTMLPNNTAIYEGVTFAITYPSASWKAAEAYDCGEEDNEKIVLYYHTDMTGSTTPKETITICTENAKTDKESFINYTNEKAQLQEQLNMGLIDSLTDQTVAGHPALVYKATRQDFPGHYEQSLLFQNHMNIYRITWSIQANSTEEKDTLQAHTQMDYSAILSSLQLK